jgi:radical SAM superfamily enzyme YgiQ (UPF0313 family)
MRVTFIQPTAPWDVQWMPSAAHGALKAYVEREVSGVTMDRYEPGVSIETTDVLAISATSENYGRACEIARKAKAYKPSIVTVIGGHHITALPETLAPEMDWGVAGEGEAALSDMLHVLIEKHKPRRGCMYRAAGPLDLDSLPFPWRDPNEPVTLQTSRGCPYACTFCSSSAFWKGVRWHSPEYVAAHVAHIASTQPNTTVLSIQDDLAIADRKRFARIVDLLDARGLAQRFAYTLAVRANLVDAELCGLLKRLRVQCVAFGAESGSDRILEAANKRATVADNQVALEVLAEAHIPCACSLIVGWPGETEDDVRATYEFRNRNMAAGKLADGVVNVLAPLPGTKVWNDWVASCDRDWDEHLDGCQYCEHNRSGEPGQPDFRWERLGPFASFRHSRFPDFAAWCQARRDNDTVYVGGVDQERLFQLMAEGEAM